MIVKCKQSDIDLILSYIGNDYPKCLYLFLNVNKYGLEHGRIKAFIQYSKGDISAVMLQYYSCLHIYSKDNSFDNEELTDFISSKKELTMLYCEASTADKIASNLSKKTDKQFTVTKGWVAQIKTLKTTPKGLAEKSESKDFEQIVKMIYDDEDIGKSYKYDELAKQLEERNQEGYSRNLVIKDNELVIAHACTNAEIGNVAVVAELLVRKEYRRKGLASEIWGDICKELLEEGKEVYSFYYSFESRALHKKLGFEEVCEWSKIVF